MKLLICRTKECGGQHAILPATKRFPGGEPYLAASHVEHVRCARCKRVSQFSAVEFNSLPTLTLEQIEDLVPGRALKDIQGAGFDEVQAKDLFKAGLRDSVALHALDRGQEGERQVQEALSNGLETAGPES